MRAFVYDSFYAFTKILSVRKMEISGNSKTGYRCNTCRSTFSRKANLDRHVDRFHNGAFQQHEDYQHDNNDNDRGSMISSVSSTAYGSMSARDRLKRLVRKADDFEDFLQRLARALALEHERGANTNDLRMLEELRPVSA